MIEVELINIIFHIIVQSKKITFSPTSVIYWNGVSLNKFLRQIWKSHSQNQVGNMI